MKILLMRHGDAGDYLGKEGKDPSNLKRELTDDGIDAVTNLGNWMSDPKRNLVPNSISCSPVVRGVQTAKILSGIFGVKYAVEQNLEISKPMEMFIKKCAADPSVKRPLIISHSDNINPGLRRLNNLDETDYDPIAKAELRILRVDRKDATWKELQRVMPSDIGGTDIY